MINKIILDIETTGLSLNGSDNDRIVEICCLKFKNDKVYNKNIFHKYINPNKIIKKEVYLIHGLNNNFLKDKPLFKDIISDLIKFIKNCDIIIHNSKFDLSFLNYEFNLLGYKNFLNYCNNIIDTLSIAKNLYPGKKNSLDALCKRFNINTESRKFHGAFIDCKLLLKVYLFMTKKDNKLLFKKNNYNNKNLNLSDNNIVLKAKSSDLILHENFLKKIFND